MSEDADEISVVKELYKMIRERIEKEGLSVCMNCDCKNDECKCGCSGVGECIICGFEAADWKCKKCGGWVCGECIVVYGNNYNLCWTCAGEVE
mgnify:CR=1 FL=1